MFLSGEKIEQAIKEGSLGILPFDRNNLKGASYTFTLASKILMLKQTGILDVEQKPEYEEHSIGSDGFILKPGTFVLGYTQEKLTLNNKYICFLSARSSLAQVGLNTLLGSFFAEPNTDSPQVIEIHNTASIPIKLRAGMKLVKGVFASL